MAERGKEESKEGRNRIHRLAVGEDTVLPASSTPKREAGGTFRKRKFIERLHSKRDEIARNANGGHEKKKMTDRADAQTGTQRGDGPQSSFQE